MTTGGGGGVYVCACAFVGGGVRMHVHVMCPHAAGRITNALMVWLYRGDLPEAS